MPWAPRRLVHESATPGLPRAFAAVPSSCEASLKLRRTIVRITYRCATLTLRPLWSGSIPIRSTRRGPRRTPCASQSRKPTQDFFHVPKPRSACHAVTDPVRIADARRPRTLILPTRQPLSITFSPAGPAAAPRSHEGLEAASFQTLLESPFWARHSRGERIDAPAGRRVSRRTDAGGAPYSEFRYFFRTTRRVLRQYSIIAQRRTLARSVHRDDSSINEHIERCACLRPRHLGVLCDHRGHGSAIYGIAILPISHHDPAPARRHQLTQRDASSAENQYPPLNWNSTCQSACAARCSTSSAEHAENAVRLALLTTRRILSFSPLTGHLPNDIAFHRFPSSHYVPALEVLIPWSGELEWLCEGFFVSR